MAVFTGYIKPRRTGLIRVGFSARPLKKELKNPRPDGLGEYERTIAIIKACGDGVLGAIICHPRQSAGVIIQSTSPML